MKKYLILSDGKSPHTIKWVKELKKYFAISLISFNGFSDEIKLCLDANQIYDCAINVKPSGGNTNILWQLPKVVQIIKKIQPDYINAHYITSYGTIAILAKFFSRTKAKVVLSAWGSDILVTPNKNIFYQFLTKIILKNADLITSDSQFMSSKIRELWSEAKTLTFPFGIEKIPTVAVKNKDEKKFFSNRALEPNYNIKLVIQIFYVLWQNDSKRRLVVAHDGSVREEIQNYVDELGMKEAVEFAGFLSEAQQQAFYNNCQYYFSLPSSDSTSVSLLEAMACGCTPIVSDLPANKEWIQDGVNGFIYNSKMPLDLTQAKEAFIINRKIISERGIWSRNIAEFISTLEKIT